jgi:hypothetical protein
MSLFTKSHYSINIVHYPIKRRKNGQHQCGARAAFWSALEYNIKQVQMKHTKKLNNPKEIQRLNEKKEDEAYVFHKHVRILIKIFRNTRITIDFCVDNTVRNNPTINNYTKNWYLQINT